MLGGVATSALRAKMSSSELKKSLHFGLFEEIIARKGGFFFDCAQRKPRVFQGGDLRLPCAKAHGFLFVRAAEAATLRVAHRDTIDLHTNHQNRSFLLAQTATSYRLDLFWFVCNGVAF